MLNVDIGHLTANDATPSSFVITLFHQFAMLAIVILHGRIKMRKQTNIYSTSVRRSARSILDMPRTNCYVTVSLESRVARLSKPICGRYFH